MESSIVVANNVRPQEYEEWRVDAPGHHVPKICCYVRTRKYEYVRLLVRSDVVSTAHIFCLLLFPSFILFHNKQQLQQQQLRRCHN